MHREWFNHNCPQDLDKTKIDSFVRPLNLAYSKNTPEGPGRTY